MIDMRGVWRRAGSDHQHFEQITVAKCIRNNYPERVGVVLLLLPGVRLAAGCQIDLPMLSGDCARTVGVTGGRRRTLSVVDIHFYIVNGYNL